MIAYYNKNTGELKELAGITNTARDVSYQDNYHLGSFDVQDAIDSIIVRLDARWIYYDSRQSGLDVNTVQAAIDKLKSNFQAGVDAVYQACVAKRSTPASSDLSDILRAIAAIPNYNDETYSFPANSHGDTIDLLDNNKVRWVNAQNVYNAGSGAGYQEGYNDGYSDGEEAGIDWGRMNVGFSVTSRHGFSKNSPVNLTINNPLERSGHVYVDFNLTGNNVYVRMNGEESSPMTKGSYSVTKNTFIVINQTEAGASEPPDDNFYDVIWYG